MSFTFEEYLKIQSHFKLGDLTTEGFHHKTAELSDVVKSDILKAVNILVDVDKDALNLLRLKAQEIFRFQQDCQKTLTAGHKVYIAGCGATGRLALSIEKLYRAKFDSDQVVGFMAGGDFALIKSVESFEDNFFFGERQLTELGFSKEDMVIGVTEGGETSFVIGATTYGAENSRMAPYFLCCNPEEELSKIERSQKIIKDPRVKKLNLTIGPMAISGSTRMQATTVQMIACGFALLYKHQNLDEFIEHFHRFIDDLIAVDKSFISKFIQAEYNWVCHNRIITYETSEDIAICTLTDTTERSPTFNLPAFNRIGTQDALSSIYLCVHGTSDVCQAWNQLLSRSPRCLDWKGIDVCINERETYLFDISEKVKATREKSGQEHALFKILGEKEKINFEFLDSQFELDRGEDLLFDHLQLKLILNTHSTLIMGLLDRFEGNMMTFVKPSNFKLIDRAARYVQELLRRENQHVDNEMIIKSIFDYQKINSDEPVVIYVKDKVKE